MAGMFAANALRTKSSASGWRTRSARHHCGIEASASGEFTRNLVGRHVYDDFPILEPAVSWESFEHLRQRIGWRFAKDYEQGIDFAESFDSLGVCVLVGSLVDVAIKLENRESRFDLRGLLTNGNNINLGAQFTSSVQLVSLIGLQNKP